MDAVKFLMEFNRMHQYYDCEDDCEGCPRQREGCSLVDKRKPYLEKFVSDVEKWSKKHPPKTRLQDFKEKYPNAEFHFNGQPRVCCAELGYRKYCNKFLFGDFEDCDNPECYKCWNEPEGDDE